MGISKCAWSHSTRFHLSTKLISVLFLTFHFSGKAFSADETEPHANLERYFFASPEAEEADRARIEEALLRLESFKGKVSENPESLLAAMQAYDALQVIYLKHSIYLRLRCAKDRSDRKSCADESEINDEAEGRSSFLKNEIARIDEEKISGDLAANNGLQAYRFALEGFRRESGHLIAPDQEILLSRLSPLTTGWQYDLFNDSLGSVDFGTVPSPEGDLGVLRDRAQIRFNRDAAVRKAGFEKFWDGFAKIRQPLAFDLLHIAHAGNQLAKLHHFENAPNAHYFRQFFDPNDTRRLIDEVSKSGGLLRRFERIRAGVLESQYGLENPQVWDESLPPRGAPSFTFDRLRSIFHAAFAEIGPTYRGAFDALLDPASERADIGLGKAENRYGGGFSVGFSGVPSMLFVGNFSGTFKDLSVIAHEGGHAVHRQLMAEADVLPAYQGGPNFLFESFAVFNELLLADYMAGQAESDLEKKFFWEQYLAIKGLDFLLGAKDAALEQAIYDGAEDGSLNTADDLDALTLSIDRQFSRWPEQVLALHRRWEVLVLAYEDPLYYVNYLYAGLLGLEYYRMFKANPDGFGQAYTALLQNGFDAPPDALLDKFLGIDLHDSSGLVSHATTVVEDVMQKLE